MSDGREVRERKLTPSGARKIPPNPDAPLLSHKREERLKPSDDRSAQGYDALEDANDKIAQMLTAVEDGAISVELHMSDTLVNILSDTSKEDRKA